MSGFAALPLGRRPIRCRVLVVYRADPGLARELLPAGLQPRLVHGRAIAAACYTRLGASPLFRLHDRDGGSDHLAYRFAVLQESGAAATWIARRETSSWLEARCGAKLLRGEYGRSIFRVKDDALAIELAVEDEGGEKFYLRGEATAVPRGSVFASAQALQDFLAEDRSVRPYDVFAPEADEIDLAHSAAEPLAVFEARSAFFAEGPFAGGAAELDSAWRIVTQRLAGEVEPAPAFRVLPDTGSPVPTA